MGDFQTGKKFKAIIFPLHEQSEDLFGIFTAMIWIIISQFSAIRFKGTQD
jgi:hypothetical protein